MQALPVREKSIILDPWLSRKRLGLLASPRGMGKTLFAMSLGNAVSAAASASIDFAWRTLTPCRVLYIDAEMPLEDAIDRLNYLGVGDNEGRFLYYSVDYYVNEYPKAHRPNLLNESYRQSLKDDVILWEGVDLVVIDNLSALTPGIDENAKKDWDVIGQWLLDLRFAGVAVLMVHHTGKGGDQRGTSAREDFLDVSLLLKRPPGYQITDGCKFICQFTPVLLTVEQI
jgi:putative DNA primase/helicase